jgi:hypothetical protein
MKSLKMLLIAMMIFAMSPGSNLFAQEKPKDKLRDEIITLIGKECPFEYNKDQCTASMLFTVNMGRELVVISVESRNPKADSYLKGRLNYKKIHFVPEKEGVIYLLPFRIVKNNEAITYK